MDVKLASKEEARSLQPPRKEVLRMCLLDVPTQHWHPDSGASFHVRNNSQNIQQLILFGGPDQIQIGNGQGLSITSSSSTCFSSPLSPTTPLFLHNLLLVLDITKILIIVNKPLIKSLLQRRVDVDGLYEFPSLLSSVLSPNCSLASFVNIVSASNARPSYFSLLWIFVLLVVMERLIDYPLTYLLLLIILRLSRCIVICGDQLLSIL
ncbi:hypothetical protein CR513_42685, partial [Mucuna pruriens]